MTSQRVGNNLSYLMRDITHPAERLVLAMARIYQYRMTTTSGGNLSIRDADGSIWITPARVDKGSLRVEDIVRVLPDGSTEGRHKPSSEFPFHKQIYDARPDLGAIVHAHPVALVAFSICGQAPDTRLFTKAHSVCGEPGFAPYALPGSVVPLLLIMGIFLTKYAVGVATAMQPALRAEVAFAMPVAVLYGVFSGLFAGRTLGLVGLGRIGRSVARMAGAFRMRVLAYDPNGSDATAGLRGRAKNLAARAACLATRPAKRLVSLTSTARWAPDFVAREESRSLGENRPMAQTPSTLSTRARQRPDSTSSGTSKTMAAVSAAAARRSVARRPASAAPPVERSTRGD